MPTLVNPALNLLLAATHRDRVSRLAYRLTGQNARGLKHFLFAILTCAHRMRVHFCPHRAIWICISTSSSSSV